MTSNSNGHQPFNPAEHFIQLKTGNKLTDYLPVQWRLVWFREQCPEGTIDTEEVIVDLDREVTEEGKVWNDQVKRYETVTKHGKGYARFKATVTDGRGGRATATKSENAASFADFIEKAETGAVGRALAMLGYGTQFTADELEEQHRIVDTPVKQPSRQIVEPEPQPPQGQSKPEASVQASELKSIMDEVAALKLAANTKQWKEWKKGVLGADVANANLQVHHLAQLRGAIEAHKRGMPQSAA